MPKISKMYGPMFSDNFISFHRFAETDINSIAINISNMPKHRRPVQAAAAVSDVSSRNYTYQLN